MLTSLSLDSFKNHKSAVFSWREKNIIFWPNGSGKTNILEAIYLLINGMPISGRTMSQSVDFASDVFSVGGGVINNDLEFDFRLGCNVAEKTVRFLFQKDAVVKIRYRESMPVRAVFFSPIEMNVLYLGPSLRRESLDETLVLAYPFFSKIKRDYNLVLRNRNALLKNIREKKASIDDLDAWNRIFIDKASEYYQYRTKLLEYIHENMSFIASLLEGKYQIRFEYITKTDLSSIKESIAEHLNQNAERDIITGHTYIGPHLDDFSFRIEMLGQTYRSDEYLSRGENKTILIGLKFLMVRFIEERSGKKSILLLDDLFSELDSDHIALLLDQVGDRQVFVTSQHIPSFIDKEAVFHTVQLY